MGKYSIIYADPPWQYDKAKGEGVAAAQYLTMSVDDIASLPVQKLADKDCVLFLWATFPKLKEALKVIEGWGFKYKTIGFIWLKQTPVSKAWFFGLGYWTRGNAEICLLATKGKPKRKSNKVHQFIISPLIRHSQKPDETRDKIVELMGDLPRIELFARQETEGWDCLGNEIDGRDIREALKDYIREEDVYEAGRLYGKPDL